MTDKTPEQTARAHELLAFLLDHQDAHDQSHWIRPFGDGDHRALYPIDAAEALNHCGTTACAAGWTALMAGAKFISARWVVTPAGESRAIEVYAGELLGLDWEEADELFFRSVTLAEVKDFIHETYGAPAGARA